MTVCELIKILQKYDPQKEVVCFDEYGEESDIVKDSISICSLGTSCYPGAILIGKFME